MSVRLPSQKEQYAQLNSRLAKYVAAVESLYEDLCKQTADAVTLVDVDGGEKFKFSSDPILQRKIDEIQKEFVSNLRTMIYSGTSDEWKRSNLFQDLVANKILRSYDSSKISYPDAEYLSWIDETLRLRNFLTDDYNKYNDRTKRHYQEIANNFYGKGMSTKKDGELQEAIKFYKTTYGADALNMKDYKDLLPREQKYRDNLDKCFEKSDRGYIVFRGGYVADRRIGGYKSTSLALHVAEGYCSFGEGKGVFVYYIPKGTPIIKYFDDNEMEVLLPRGFNLSDYEIARHTSLISSSGEEYKGIDTAKLQELLRREKHTQYYRENSDALKAFQYRKDKGLNLSQKLWKQSASLKTEMEDALSCSIEKGIDAVTLSKRLSKYLNDFPSLQADYTAKFGTASKAVDCEYRSIRLARSEINMAYRTAEQTRWRQFDFVVGYEIKLSHSHPREDVCDRLAGKYPKDFVWSGWHPNDLCYCIPILKSEEEFIDDNDKQSASEITDVPQEFKDWCIDNKDRISVAMERDTLPYFLCNNIDRVNTILSAKYNKTMLK